MPIPLIKKKIKLEKELELNQKDSLVETKDSNKVIVIFFLLGIGLVLSALANLGFVFLSLHLGTREKIFVARQGAVEIAEEKDPYFRSDAVIQRTVKDFLYLTEEWNSKIPNPEVPGSTIRDTGFQIQGDSNEGYFRVPSRVYAGSYLLEIGFRKKFLHAISKEIHSSFYHGRFSSVLDIYHVGKPKRIDKNLYEVEAIITRTERNEHTETREVKLHKMIYLQSTTPDELVLGDKEPDAFRKEVNKLLKNGLKIYEILPVS